MLKLKGNRKTRLRSFHFFQSSLSRCCFHIQNSNNEAPIKHELNSFSYTYDPLVRKSKFVRIPLSFQIPRRRITNQRKENLPSRSTRRVLDNFIKHYISHHQVQPVNRSPATATAPILRLDVGRNHNGSFSKL